MDILSLSTQFQLSSWQWALACLAIFIMGINKAGIKGIAVLFVTLMALAFGSKASTGLVVPMLVVGDVIAVYYYRKNARWDILVKLIPSMMIGVLLATYFGKDLPEESFKKALAIIILFSLLVMVFWEQRKSKTVPNHWSFAIFMGIGAGFTTMIGNLAGAFANIFFLSIKLSKKEFIGTAATLFFILNLFKLPIHIFVWKTISIESLAVNLRLLPFIFLGFVIGLQIVNKINSDNFRKLVMVMTAIGAMIILSG